MRRAFLGVMVAVLLAACSGDDSTSSTATTRASARSSTSMSFPTTTFNGSTAPTSIASKATQTALLTDVRVGRGVVTFVFRADLPGVDVAFVQPPITQDGSGATVDVEGTAFLSVRMEPASSVDMNSGSANPEETYTGPSRIPGSSGIAEVVRTGDFEANLTWVIGLDAKRAYRVEAAASMIRVYFSM